MEEGNRKIKNYFSFSLSNVLMIKPFAGMGLESDWYLALDKWFAEHQSKNK